MELTKFKQEYDLVMEKGEILLVGDYEMLEISPEDWTEAVADFYDCNSEGIATFYDPIIDVDIEWGLEDLLYDISFDDAYEVARKLYLNKKYTKVDE